MRKPILSNFHWFHEDFTQRMTTKQWESLLLNEEDKIVFRGHVRQLIARKLSANIVEIRKAPARKE